MIKASIILSNYESLKFLPKCLKHLLNQSYPNYEIIFVDAGSTDGSPDFVKKKYPEVKVIRCGRIGIGEAVNIGIRNADGDIIVFDVNTDEYVETNWLEELISQLQHFRYKIIAGPVRIIYGTNLIDEAGVNLNFLGRSEKLGHRQAVDGFSFNGEPVDFVGAPAFHRKILDEIGFIDETYFIYAEDLDFCHRARLAGYPTYVVPLARSYHHIRGTIGTNDRRLEYYLRRANIRFQLIYSAPQKLIPASFYYGFWLPALAFAMMIIPGRFSRLYKEKFIGRAKAVIWNLRNLRQTLRSRDVVKNLKKMRTDTTHKQQRLEPTRGSFMTRTGVILAAGLGARMSESTGQPNIVKPLAQVDGLIILLRTIKSLEIAGCDSIVIVLGYQAKKIKNYITTHYSGNTKLQFAVNQKFHLQNGLSVLCARPLAPQEFILTMADHILDDGIMKLIWNHRPPSKGLTLCVDFKLDSIFDTDDATKVLCKDNRIIKIGKDLNNYNAVDTGVFVATSGLMDVLEDVFHCKGDASLSQGVQALADNRLATVLDIKDAFWQDVDNYEMLLHAENLLRADKKNLKTVHPNHELRCKHETKLL